MASTDKSLNPTPENVLEPIPEECLKLATEEDLEATPEKGLEPTSEKRADPSPEPIPAKEMSVGEDVVEKGAMMIPSFDYLCGFAMYSHDMSRQIETHHFCTPFSESLYQSIVCDSGQPNARILGVEYVVTDDVFETLPPEEQKLWHSHVYEIKSGLWVNPKAPEAEGKAELEKFVKTYGKFWCTWQADKGDKVPMGAPALMTTPQAVSPGLVRPELVRERDAKLGISSESLKESRLDIPEPQINPLADYWMQHGKGFAVEIVETEMQVSAPFP